MTDEAALPASFVIEWLETVLVEVPCTQSLGLSGFALRDPGTDPLGGFGLSSWPLGLELAAERPDRLCVDDPYSVSAQFVLRAQAASGVAASRFPRSTCTPSSTCRRGLLSLGAAPATCHCD